MTTSFDDVLARARESLKNSPIMPPAAPLHVRLPTPEKPVKRRRITDGLINRYSSRDADKFVIRLPDDLRGKVAAFADFNNRSSNSEFLTAIEWWLDKQALMQAMLTGMQSELERLEHLREGAVGRVLDDLAQHHPQAESAIKTLKALIREG